MNISTKPKLQNLTKSSIKPTAIIVYQSLIKQQLVSLLLARVGKDPSWDI